MISTSAFGSASFASTQARAGRFFGSTQAVHTSFIGARFTYLQLLDQIGEEAIRRANKAMDDLKKPHK